jgi:hypothetical protein
VLAIAIFNSVNAQVPDSTRSMADQAVKSFTWDIEQVPRGTLMFLDVPFKRENLDSAEYLTLAVAKDKQQARPQFISIILPNDVIQKNGILMSFAKTVQTQKPPGWAVEPEQARPEKIPFDHCDQDKQSCTARIIGGYLEDDSTKQKVDIFQKLLDFDQIYFRVSYPDGSQKSIAIPLFSFKQQYHAL